MEEERTLLPVRVAHAFRQLADKKSRAVHLDHSGVPDTVAWHMPRAKQVAQDLVDRAIHELGVAMLRETLTRSGHKLQ